MRVVFILCAMEVHLCCDEDAHLVMKYSHHVMSTVYVENGQGVKRTIPISVFAKTLYSEFSKTLKRFCYKLLSSYILLIVV